MENIRNFCIIAHIDHGKSTLADRFLEITNTVDKRKMQAQYLDQMELERERGITIKMAPVRMSYIFNSKSYILNLIDTPGHSDFSYEVSRALFAVEGAILLVDATQGIQAQTLSNFRAAERAGLKIIGAVNKIDMNPSGVEELINDLAELINSSSKEIYKISGKTNEGVENLLRAVVEKIPPPSHRYNNGNNLLVHDDAPSRALIFDSFYDNHKGIVASVRVFDGEFAKDDSALLFATKTNFKVKEIGFFCPQLKTKDKLTIGEIGYIATGVKDPEMVRIGDTVIGNLKLKNENYQPLAGYKEPHSVVFVSFYPEDADAYESLRLALQKLKLNDSSLSIEQDQNEVLSRGFKVGFLGQLHFEIVAERLEREFNISIVTTFPSVAYRVKTSAGWEIIVNPQDLPNNFLEIWEPMVKIEIILPLDYLSNFFALQQKFRLEEVQTETIHNRGVVSAVMPLAELMSDFDDHLKSMSRGYASFSYELGDYKKSDIVKIDILIAGEIIPGLSRFFHRSVFEKEARKMLERLKDLLPQQQFSQSLQASALGRVIARENIQAMRKDVTGHLYGGDRSRKMKLWKKQKRGKEKLKERASVKISPEIFKELLKK